MMAELPITQRAPNCFGCCHCRRERAKTETADESGGAVLRQQQPGLTPLAADEGVNSIG